MAKAVTKILIDTCVWLDVAKDHKQQAIISVLDDLIESKRVELILPKIIVDEFNRNKTRILEDSRRSIVGLINRVKEMVNKFGDDVDKQQVITHLSDIQHKSPLLSEYAAQGSINWISTLLEQTKTKKATNTIKLKATQRAIEKIAPFHRAKNNMADAIIFETYLAELQADTSRNTHFIFVTHNTEDFSLPGGNQKLPHPDFTPFFSTKKSKYFISISEALNSIESKLISEMIMEREVFNRNPRTLTEILAAEDELVTKVWYNRHQIRSEMIEEGTLRIIEDKDFSIENSADTITKSIWEGAKKSAKKVEKRFRGETLLWNDFEWGMLNGKLSALRWVLGEDWDELYT
jgi:hypothetical protein